MESILLYHCRALLMDEENTLLDPAYVVVRGSASPPSPPPAPRAPLPRRSTAGATS